MLPLPDMSDRGARTIRAFGDQWTRFSDNDGFYGSTSLLSDVLGPLISLDELRGASVADIGSGSGRIVNMLLEAGVGHVIAVEPSDAFTVLQQNVAAPDKVTFLHGTGDQLPASGTLDFVLAIGVLHHIPDPAPVVQAAYRALRPGGRLVVWLYGREGNGLYLLFASPLRQVTTRLPHPLVAGLSVALEWALRGYMRLARGSRLPLATYVDLLDRLGPEKRRLVIYDQLRPAYSRYYTRAEAEQLLVPPFPSAQLHHRRGYSWTGVARKPGALTPDPQP